MSGQHQCPEVISLDGVSSPGSSLLNATDAALSHVILRASREAASIAGSGFDPETVHKDVSSGYWDSRLLSNGPPVLQVRDLVIANRSGRRIVGPISFDVGAGERVGLIGESGSGKSLTALAIMGLLPDNLHATGRVVLAGQDVLNLPDKAAAPLRGQVASMIFQEPMTALDPTMRVGRQVAEVLTVHGRATKAQADAAAVAALAEVGLPDPSATARAYPHQLSGGQRQRVLIAMAMANNPALLIADEPTTALDVTVQQQVLYLMRGLVGQRGSGLLFITHDLAVVSQVAERILVLADGLIIEEGPVKQVLRAPVQPYTQALLAATALPSRVETVFETGTVGGFLTSPIRFTNRRGPRVDSAQPPTKALPIIGQPSVILHERSEGAGSSSSPQAAPIISLRDVSKVYAPRAQSWFPWTRRASAATSGQVAALDDVCLDIYPGEHFGIVGESGSGKTTLLKIIAALLPPSSGTVEVAGVPLTATTPPADLARVRSQLQLVFQDPMGSLDPRMTLAQIVAEPLLNQGGRAAKHSDLVAQTLADVGLPPDSATRYPHEFSGGQRQRISIARALITRPQILLADEPVSALDVTVRAQVLELLARLAAERELTLVLVSHDLAVVRHLCDRVAVMHAGQIVEVGPTEQVWNQPQAQYTADLIAATPTLAA